MTLSLLNSLAVALTMVFSGRAGQFLSPVRVLAIASPVALAIVSLAALWDGATWSTDGIIIGVVAGSTGALGLLFSYRALAVGPIGVAGAVIGVTSTATVAVAGFLTESPLTLPAAGGFALCVIAIVLVTWSSPAERVSASMVISAFVGGLAAGGFAVLMNLTSPEDGWAPLVAVRVSVVIVAFFALLIPSARVRRSGPLTRRTDGWIPASLAGVADAIANISLVLAVRTVDLATIAIVTSVAPGLAALVAWLFLRQRLRPRQTVGVLLAVTAISLTSLMTT